jgi:lipopolysaccharide assembly outer membrane protein LptD (OstA)
MNFKVYMCIFTLFAFSIFGEEIKYKADNLKINFDENGNISSVLLEGNVVIFYKNITIKTEKAIYERK